MRAENASLRCEYESHSFLIHSNNVRHISAQVVYKILSSYVVKLLQTIKFFILFQFFIIVVINKSLKT